MPFVEERAFIARTPEAVHAFVRDHNRYPEWITFTKAVTKVEGDGGPGTKYWEKGTGGRSTWEVIEVEMARREVHVGDIGIARARIEITFAKKGRGKNAGTDYVHRIEYTMKVPVVGRVIRFVALDRMMRNGLKQTVANLKRILEA